MTYPAHIQAMLQPDFYPHPVDSVRLEQTHISYVFLTGPYAYKVKKPVQMPFLDFRTLEQRRHFCLEELRLNRRFSRELYLDVQAIEPTPSGFALASLETPSAVDYCVVMRQFPSEERMDLVSKRESLTVEPLEAFIKQLAAVHAAAPAHAVDLPDRVRNVVMGNFTALEPFVERLVARNALDGLKTFSLDRLTRLNEQLTARGKFGRVRECHGDLHARNVARYDGAWHPFDAIEFGESYRIIDVLAEVAFFVMDLEALGFPALANRCLNLYLERSGDWDGIPTLPLYLTYRALVRAKINALTSNDANVEAQAHEEAARDTARYLKLADHYRRRFTEGNGTLTIMFGLSGSGKSTVAKKLAMEQGAIHIRSDAVRKHLAGCLLDGSPSEETRQRLYTNEMTLKTFERMARLARAALEAGFPVVLDGRYAKRLERDAVRRLASECGAKFRIVQCEAPHDELIRRLRSRMGDVSDAGPELLESQRAGTEPLAADELGDLVSSSAETTDKKH